MKTVDTSHELQQLLHLIEAELATEVDGRLSRKGISLLQERVQRLLTEVRAETSIKRYEPSR
jgi:hypothetical protein